MRAAARDEKWIRDRRKEVGATLREICLAYERRKSEWLAAHPGASAEEYARAMRQIADEVGA